MIRPVRAICVLATLAFCACGRSVVESRTSALECSELDASATCVTPTLTYETVKPIFAKSCVPCHADAADSNWPLLTYREIADWSDVIAGDIINCTMPPADGGVPISDGDRRTLVSWFVCGDPQ